MPPSPRARPAAPRRNLPTQALLQALADNIRSARRARGWTQEALGARARLERTYVSHLEGQRIKNPTLGSLSTLARALGMKVSELLMDTKADRVSARDLLSRLPSPHSKGP